MSTIKKAQSIANRIQDRVAFNVVAYQRDEIEWLKTQLEDFLDTEIETEELTDPDEIDAFEGLSEEENDEEHEAYSNLEE
jgi:hypothetical protein